MCRRESRLIWQVARGFSDDPDVVGDDSVDMGCYEYGYPKVSLVFVLDGSTSMFVRNEPSYFELARDGVVEFLSLPGFPTNMDLEVSVIQFTAARRLGVHGVHALDWAYLDHRFGRPSTPKRQSGATRTLWPLLGQPA